MNIDEVWNAIDKYCGEFSQYLFNTMFLVPEVGTHIIISSNVNLQDYNEYLTDTEHYNTCSTDMKLPRLLDGEVRTIVYSWDGDTAQFMTLVPKYLKEAEPIINYVKDSPNYADLEPVLRDKVKQYYTDNRDYTKSYYVRYFSEDNYPVYAFFETDDAERLLESSDDYIPSELYDASETFGLCGMYGLSVYLAE